MFRNPHIVILLSARLPGLCALVVGVDSDGESGDGARVSTSKPGSFQRWGLGLRKFRGVL